MVKEQKTERKQIPIGVKIISVFYCLSAIFGFIFLITQFMQVPAIKEISPLLLKLVDFLRMISLFTGLGYGSLFLGPYSFVLLLEVGSQLSKIFGVVFTRIILVGLQVLSFFIGICLWKGQKWSRIVVIAYASLGIFLSFRFFSFITHFNLFTYIALLINLAMGAYLIFSKDVKSAFK